MNGLKESVVIKETDSINNTIYQLLLLADPSPKLVDDYINRGLIFIASYNNDIVGEYVLINTHPKTMEIINIAVKEKYQGKGLGKLLLNNAIKNAKLYGAEILEIGTANSSLLQLALYQKVGFRITGIDKGFFLSHYEKPMYENKIQCLDMIRLSMELI